MTKPDATPAPAARLVWFKIDHGQLPSGINLNVTVNTDNPPGHFIGWSLAIRGAAVYLITPKGWTRDRSSGSQAGFDRNGPHTIFEVPRTHCTFGWETADLKIVDGLQRFDVPAMQAKQREPEPSADPTMGDP